MREGLTRHGLTRRAALAAGTLALAWGPRNSRAQQAEIRSFDQALVSSETKELPQFGFTLADGTQRSLADYAGKPLVLNLWATWCIPCVAEMPELAKLAREQAPGLLVLPLSSDRQGEKVVSAWFDGHHIDGLPVLLDPRGAAARALGARGLPTTILIGADGKEHGRLEGAVPWTAPESIVRLKSLLAIG